MSAKPSPREFVYRADDLKHAYIRLYADCEALTERAEAAEAEAARLTEDYWRLRDEVADLTAAVERVRKVCNADPGVGRAHRLIQVCDVQEALDGIK